MSKPPLSTALGFSPADLVGRDAELTSLTAVLPGVLAGRLQAVVIGGTAGIGKTRLATEVLKAARGQGFTILSASTAPLEQDLSYASLIRALRPLLEGDRDRRDELVAGLPGLGRLFDDLELPAPSPDLGDPGLERTRLYEAVRQFVRRAAEIRPIALLVDDVQWLDPASQALLGHLARSLPGSRLLILLTCRDDEPAVPDDGIPLLSTLRWAARTPTLACASAVTTGLSLLELTLTGLAESDLPALASGLLDGQPPRALLQLLTARSAGVPLFVHALLSTLAATGSLTRVAGRWVLRPTDPRTVPEVARTVLAHRLDALSPVLRPVLEVVCLSWETTARTVAGITGTGPAETIDALDELRRSGLVVEDAAGRTTVFRASHPMLAEVAVGALPTARRQELHAAAARTLQQDGKPDVSKLAHHLLGAGPLVDPAEVLGVLVEAVDAALHRRAGDEAVALARAGLDIIAEQLPTGPRAKLLLALAHGAKMGGRFDEALVAMLDAAESGHPVARAQRLGIAALLAWNVGQVDLAERCLRDADQLIDERPAGPIHLFLAELALRNAANNARRDVLDAVLRRLTTLAERTGFIRARAVLETARLIRDLDDGRTADALRRVDNLLSLSQRVASPLFIESVLRSVTRALIRAGDLVGAADCADEGIALAKWLAAPALAVVHLAHLGMVRLQQGQYADVSAIAGKLVEIGEQTGMARATALGMTELALLARALGRTTEAEALLNEVGDRYHLLADADRPLFGLVDLARAQIQLDHGDVAGAEKTARAALGRRTPVRIFVLSLHGQVLAIEGRWAEASAALDQLRAQTSGKDLTATLADRLEAQLAAVRGERESAASLFAAAADGFDRLGMTVDAAQAWLEAISRLPSPAPEWLGTRSPRALVERALQVLVECGVETGVNQARSLLREHGGKPEPQSPRRGRTTGVTPREEEVVRLVAAGLSNPQIAERLYISTRTVTTHLQKVYARLGVKSRVEMTHWVTEHLTP